VCTPSKSSDLLKWMLQKVTGDRATFLTYNKFTGFWYPSKQILDFTYNISDQIGVKALTTATIHAFMYNTKLSWFY
jgi:hypothetical protein